MSVIFFEPLSRLNTMSSDSTFELYGTKWYYGKNSLERMKTAILDEHIVYIARQTPGKTKPSYCFGSYIHWDDFFVHWSDVPQEHRTFNEIITGDRKCKMYFDIDKNDTSMSSIEVQLSKT